MRASPYGFGMLSATLYHKNKGRDFLKEANIVIEWIVFILLIYIGWFGVTPGTHGYLPS